MSEERIPRQIEEADERAQSMSPQEAFVHSCIDGVLNVDDIADLTVLEPALVSESIERLIEMGIVEWLGAKVSSAPPAAQLIEDVEIDEALQQE
ncbi:MAG: hypothetical protein WCB63_17700, partial [Polyangiales bacterium]